MKLFYSPATKAVIAKYNNKFVLLPNVKRVDKPKKFIPYQPFLKECKNSKWYDIPDDAFCAYLNKYNNLNPSDERPCIVKIHKIEVTITYTTNEVGKSLFKLSGKVPHYVLNGIANVLKEEYYDSIK